MGRTKEGIKDRMTQQLEEEPLFFISKTSQFTQERLILDIGMGAHIVDDVTQRARSYRDVTTVCHQHYWYHRYSLWFSVTGMRFYRVLDTYK